MNSALKTHTGIISVDSSKTSNVVSIPTKKNAEDIGNFVTEYAEATVEQKTKPTHIMIIELYDVGEDTICQHFIGGPGMRIYEMIGALELLKDMLLRKGVSGE